MDSTHLTNLPEWKALVEHQKEMAKVHMRALFEQDPERFKKFSFCWEGVMVDYSKNIISEETIKLLRQLAARCDIKGWTEQMFTGARINFTENRFTTTFTS